VPKPPKPVLTPVAGLVPKPPNPPVVPNELCCWGFAVLKPPNKEGADVVGAEMLKPPKPPKPVPLIVLVGAAEPKPNADVEAVGVVPKAPPLLPNPKLEAGVLKVVVAVVEDVAPKPVAAGVPKPAPVPNPVVC
jgi:hypothetical protein